RMPRRLISDDDDFEPPRKRMVPTAVPYGSPPICSLTELARSMGKNSRQWSSQQYNMGGYKPAYTGKGYILLNVKLQRSIPHLTVVKSRTHRFRKRHRVGAYTL
ncbi:unnamed protein product, partial [Dicrocoelium dendriticum]